MGNYLSVPILGLMAILQASILPLSLGDNVPNMVFVFVLAWAINAGVQQGVIWAFVGGIMLDLLSTIPLGTSVIGMLVLVYVLSGIGLQFFRFGAIWLLLLTVIASFLHEMWIVIAVDSYQWFGMMPASAPGFNVNWGMDLNTVVIPTLVYNLIVILPVYIIVRRIQRRIGIIPT